MSYAGNPGTTLGGTMARTTPSGVFFPPPSLINLGICSDRILTFGIRSIRSPAKVGIGYL